jgi:ribosomal protein S18 acetylase RimI-like enzyme
MTSTVAPSISTVGAADKERAIATITAAFTSDPVLRWVMPDSQQYLTYFPELVRRFAGKAFEGESAYATDAFAGASLWLRPGVEPEQEPLIELIQQAIPEADQENVFAMLGKMGEYHPQEPLWYLPVIGVDPVRQGMGLGSALLSHVLAECDREGKPAYLEASSPRSRDLYLRHGFEVTGTIQVADSPPFWPMLRKAR